MAGHKFQPMASLMFQNQNITYSVTRSPIELFWTAKKILSLTTILKQWSWFDDQDDEHNYDYEDKTEDVSLLTIMIFCA